SAPSPSERGALTCPRSRGSGSRRGPFESRQGRYQLLHIGYADAGDHVVSGTGAERAVAAGREVEKTAAAQQRIKLWRQEGERGLSSLAARFIDQGAEACPAWRAPTGAADLLPLAVQDHACAGVRIGGERDIRHQPLVARGHARSLLPGLPG